MAKVDAVTKANIANINDLTIPADGVGTPAAAYSVRLLGSALGISSYTGACMRVRRASDSVEADVGFDTSDELSLTSPISNTSDAQSYTDLADFVDHTGTPTDAFVRYWYDQSSGNDAGQSTAGSQPQLYDATTGLIEQGSVGNEKAAVYNAGSKNLNTGLFAIGTSGDITLDFFSVMTNNSTSDGILMAFGDNTTTTDRRRVLMYRNDSSTQKSIRLYGGFTVVNSSIAGQTLFNTNYQGGGGAFDIRFDGSSATVSSSNNTGLNIQSNSGFALFAGDSRSYPEITATSSLSVGYIQEAIFYLSDQGTFRSSIETNMNGHFSIF